MDVRGGYFSTVFALVLMIPGILYGDEPLPVEDSESEERETAEEETEPDDVRVVTQQSLGSRTESEVVRPSMTLDGDSLDRRRNAGNIGEVLDGVAGVSSADFGPGVGRPTIRGLQGSRVQILEDGMRTSDVSGEGVDHVVSGKTLGTEAIEIIRGPATLLYGSGASGGVVNIVTGRFDPRIGDNPSGEIQGSFGFNGRDRQGQFNLEVPVSDEFALRGGLGARASEDFQISGLQVAEETGDENRGIPGRLINSDVGEHHYSLTGIWAPQWGHIGVGYERWNGEYGIAEPFDPVGGQEDEFERIFAGYHRFDLRGEAYDVLPGIEAMRVNLALTDFDQDEDEFEFDRESGAQIERFTEATFEQEELDGRLELSHVPVGVARGVFGVDVNVEDFRADDPRAGSDFFIQPARTTQAGAFLAEQLDLTWGDIEFGGRVGLVDVRPEPIEDPQVTEVRVDDELLAEYDGDPGVRQYVPTSASLGTRVDLGDEQWMRATASRSERTPAVEQLFAFGRHGAADSWEVGNPDLELETYYNGELSFHRRSDSTRLETTAFYNHVDDFVVFAAQTDEQGNEIRMARDGQSVDDGGERLVINQAADVRFYGVELDLEQDFALGDVPMTWHVNGDIVFGETRDGSNLPLMTPPRAGTGLSAAFGDLGLHANVQRIFAQDRTAEAERPTEGYNLLGGDIRWSPRAHEGFEAYLSGRNLLNVQGRRHHSFFKDYAPILGRNVIAGATYRFQ